jgi:predicted Zn-dependent protease
VKSRIEIFEEMLQADPENAMVFFGLAKEYEKLGEHAKVISLIENYLAKASDEGNAYGTLAKAYERSGDIERARAAYKKGIEIALAHGHPTMAGDFQANLQMIED